MSIIIVPMVFSVVKSALSRFLKKPRFGGTNCAVTQIELFPDLSHCIQTVARQEFHNSASKLMAGEYGNEELKQRIELLRAFLEAMDFAKLRRESEEHLTRGEAVRFVIYWKENKPRYEIIVG